MGLSFKWKKILFIHFINLATKNEIEQLVHRFELADFNKLISEIEYDVQQSLQNNLKCIYIVALVSIQHQYKLPNYLVKSLNDLKGLYSFIYNNSKKNYNEIWYYKIKECQACGRILFSDKDIYNQTIEIINGNTVRNLERGVYNFYFIAERINWGWSYRIRKSYISKNKTISNEYFTNILAKVFVSFEKRKDNLICLNTFFNSLGLDNYSFDFLLIDDVFHIIDWDTQNDKKVFDFLEKNNFKLWNDYYMNIEE